MKVLIINYEFPPLGSGASNATLHLSRQLSRRGHRLVVLTSLFRGLHRCEELDGFQVVRIPVLRARLDRCPPHELLSFTLSSVPEALAVARGMKPDCVLAFFGFPGGPAAWAVKQALGIPYVLSLRNADVPRRALAESRLLQYPLEVLVRRLWRGADGLVSVSAGLRDEVLKLKPGLSIRVIPNGVDTATFHPAEERGEAALRRDAPIRLLYVGRLRRFKGLQDLLPALPAVQGQTGRPVRLEIIGDGPYRSALERQAASLGLGSAVRFVGRLPREAMPARYRAADILVMPSYAEGMPNAILEALASGLPTVATDVEGSRELVRTGMEGVLVPTHNPEALAQAIIRVAAPEESARFGRAARERAMSFSWERGADEYLDVMRRVCS